MTERGKASFYRSLSPARPVRSLRASLRRATLGRAARTAWFQQDSIDTGAQ